MDWSQIGTILGSVLGGGGGVGIAWFESRRRARREAQIERNAEQKFAVDERTEILGLINSQLVTPLKEELEDIRKRLKEAEEKIDHLEDTNDRLVAFIYKLIGMARFHGYDKDILPADVPPGIHL
ncbi:hypothetical protein AB6813_04905 [bacterium RCC_150]